ncbi:MAG: hypothetical protein GX800_12100, partial [Clostridiaceae bacterium]|nr:hypothetical protein [Clostridiaceae bacterium]
TTPYTKEYKLFVCPSGKDKPSKNGVLLSPVDGSYHLTDGTCSYAYAYGLSIQTHSETAIMADRKSIRGVSGLAWDKNNYTQLHKYCQLHKSEGVNIMYVGGHVRWIPADTKRHNTYSYMDAKGAFALNCGVRNFPMYNLHNKY